jgi:hypothetical protein
VCSARQYCQRGGPRYVAVDRREEVCRLVWGVAGQTAASAEMHVELLRAAETGVTRRLHRAAAWSSTFRLAGQATGRLQKNLSLFWTQAGRTHGFGVLAERRRR